MTALLQQQQQQQLFLEAVQKLKPSLGILDSLNVRHRNQHGSSSWWSRFGILRRSVKKLCADGDPNIAAARAAWMKSHVIPDSYLSFSQLAADNRHAPLGLALLGLLASIRSAIVTILPPAASDSRPSLASEVDKGRPVTVSEPDHPPESVQGGAPGGRERRKKKDKTRNGSKRRNNDISALFKGLK